MTKYQQGLEQRGENSFIHHRQITPLLVTEGYQAE
jgi:hypothetical protein